MSSFSGKIKEYPQISVDRFDGRHLASTAYFLSHHHSDHMVGLSSPQFLDHLESNSGVYLYCSRITARFLQNNIRYRPLSPFIHPLQVEESVKITIPNITEDAGEQHLWVTLIPAGHCPGSVMFLFEGRGGTVLYTGDFRIGVGEAAGIRALHNSDGTMKTIDHLHIDTTFCHQDIVQFPTREESLTAILELVEEWLAKGNNFLIHLQCPANYGYEFVYKGLHERFGMKIHVNRWKNRMYSSVPEILDILTLDATETWIHACDGKTNENEEEDCSRHLPCRCVPYGVDTEPNIRLIRPSAIYFTMYQSLKEIKKVACGGTFCRVLLSMHASCSEILDLVSYIRPRKVSPTVIPFNSTREEVLKLLHKALNSAGDHYSIEYVGSQRRSLGSFKRQLDSSLTSSSSLLDAGLLDSFMSSPSKRRRHSDSNMTLMLPTPRGNMKGSLSLEGEARHDTNIVNTNDDSEDVVWQDPYLSPEKCSGILSQIVSSPSVFDISPRSKDNDDDRVQIKQRVRIVNYSESVAESRGSSSSKISSSSFTSPEDVDVLSRIESQDSVNSVFSDEEEQKRPASCTGVPGESAIKQNRKLWYKHKYFSTPVHEEEKIETILPRSSSLPCPEYCPTYVQDEDQVPLITITQSDQDSPEIVQVSPTILSDRPSVICAPMHKTELNGSWIDCKGIKGKKRKLAPPTIDISEDSPPSSSCKKQAMDSSTQAFDHVL